MNQFSLGSLLKQYRGMIFLSAVTSIMLSTLALAMPLVLKIVIDRVLPAKDWGLFFLLTVVLLFVACGKEGESGGGSETSEISSDVFPYTKNGQILYYRSVGDHAEVTHPIPSWEGYLQPEGDIVIPETITYQGKSYTVNSIGDSAFYGCYHLVEVCNQSSLPIADAIGTADYGYIARYALRVYSEGESKISINNSPTITANSKGRLGVVKRPPRMIPTERTMTSLRKGYLFQFIARFHKLAQVTKFLLHGNGNFNFFV